MGYVKLASQTSSNKKRAAELASRSVISSSSSSKSRNTSKAIESPTEYAIKAGIPASDLVKAGMPESVVQAVAAAQGNNVSTYGSESPLAASKKTSGKQPTTENATISTVNVSSSGAGSAGKEYVFQFSGAISSKAVSYLSRLVKLLGGKRAYIEDQTKIVVVM
jgi:hypothetical protein